MRRKGGKKRRNGEGRGRQRGGEWNLEPEVTDYTHAMGIDRFHSAVNGRY